MTCLINPEINNNRNGSKALIREEVQQRLATAMAVVNNPTTVFCIQPFPAVECDGAENLRRLLIHVKSDPDHALVISTGTALVFAFADQVGRGESNGSHHDP